MGNMKNLFFLSLSLIWCLSCNKKESNEYHDLSPGVDSIEIKSSSYTIPLNGSGIAFLSAFNNLGDDITGSTTFYVNSQKLALNEFIPAAPGTYFIEGKFHDLSSAPIEISVEPPLNKKVLIESFTSRTCGFCPWIGARLDSLDKANANVISYSIHGQDELEINETYPLQELLAVYSRPSVRVNRGYVRNFDAPIEIQELLDSVGFYLSFQPKLEIAIESEINQSNLSVKVFGKYHENISENIFLTCLIAEDSMITQDQYNYFNGYPWTFCPFASLPFYLPDYVNHNVLRKVISNTHGDPITPVPFEKGVVQEMGNYTFTIPDGMDVKQTKIIAIVHRTQAGIESSTVLNSQLAGAGNQVGFSE